MDHVTDQKSYEITASILMASPPQPDGSQQPLSNQDPKAIQVTSAADAAHSGDRLDPTAASFEPAVSSPDKPRYPASTATQNKTRFPRLPGHPIRISRPVEQNDRISGSDKGDKTGST